MEPPPIVFGPARRRDYDAYVHLVTESLGPVDLLRRMDVRAPHALRAAFRGFSGFLLRLLSLWGRAPVQVLAARDGERVVGTTVVIYLPKTGYISTVATDSRYRGQGIASRLLAMSEESIRKRKRRWAALDVETTNSTAFRLYSGRGYRTIQKVGWYRRPSNLLLPPPPAAFEGVRVCGTGAPSARAAAEWCAAHTPPAVTAPFPPTASVLSVLEFTGVFESGAVQTWQLQEGGEVQGYARAHRLAEGDPSFLFLPALAPGSSREGLTALLSTGLGWVLRAPSPGVVCPLPEFESSAQEPLQALGFARAGETVTMLREV